MSGTREENVFMARLSEQADRYEDMVTYMTRVANMGSELSIEERNLLSVAFKNAVGACRQAWRSIAGMQGKEDPGMPHLASVQGYRNKVETEMKSKCEEILTLLQKADGLVATASNSEAQVFYLKMEGDYHRYLAEFSRAEEQAKCAQNADVAYSKAMARADDLPATHPIRLGLALNYSVFYYEVYGRAAEACALAKTSFDKAVVELPSLPLNQAQDAQSILQLLNDNLTLWQSDLAGQGEGKPPEQDGTQCEDL